MDRTEAVVLTNMCMVCDGMGNVLAQERRNPNWPGVTFPGGHVEAGESFADAVKREVKEETGLDIAHPRLCGVKDWTNPDGSRYMVLLYRTRYFSGELQSSGEGRVFWVPLKDLQALPLARGMDQMLRVFLEDDLSELVYTITADGEWKGELK